MMCLNHATALTILLAGCAVGPDRRTAPPLPLPNSFQEEGGETPLVDRWWEGFGDQTLNSLIERALTENQDLLAGWSRVEAARAAPGRAASGGRPTLGLAANRDWLSASRQSPGLAGAGVRSGLVDRDQDVHRVGIDASWELDLFGAVQRRTEAADARVAQRQAALDGIALRIAAEVAVHYFELRFAEQQEQNASARLDSTLRSLRRTEIRRAAGLIDAAPATRLEIAVSRQRAVPGLHAAEAAAATRRLAILMGTPPEAFSIARAATTTHEIPPSPRLGVPSALLRRRPDLRAMEAELAATTAAVGMATADLYPRLFLLGGAALESQSFDRLFRSGALQQSFGPSINLPLFRGGALRQALRIAEAQEREVLARFAQATLYALAEVESAVQRLAARRFALRAAAAATQNAGRLSQLARSRLRAGLTDRESVLRAERDVLDAEDREAEARLEAARGLIRVFKALGGGSGAAAQLPS